MAVPSQSFQQIKSFFHTFGKLNTEATQYIFESKFKSAHNVLVKDIWAEPIPYAYDQTAADAAAALYPSRIKKYVNFPLTQVPGSNGQAYYIDDGGVYVADWISPVDSLSSSTPSFGYKASLAQSDNTPIPETAGVYIMDYHAGVVMFEQGYTPANMGWGTPKITCYAYVGRRGGGIDAISQSEVTLDAGDTKDVSTFSGTLYRTVEWLISVTDGTDGTFRSEKIIAHHDNVNCTHTEFAILGAASVVFDVVYDSGVIRLVATASKDAQTVKTVNIAVELA